MVGESAIMGVRGWADYFILTSFHACQRSKRVSHGLFPCRRVTGCRFVPHARTDASAFVPLRGMVNGKRGTAVLARRYAAAAKRV